MKDEFDSDEDELMDWLKWLSQVARKEAKSRQPRSPYWEGIRE